MTSNVQTVRELPTLCRERSDCNSLARFATLKQPDFDNPHFFGNFPEA